MTSKGASIDVGAWLRDRGLGQYEAAFRENEIDIDILAELTEAHLEKLGMPLGHRIRVLKAIANLEASERSAVAVAPAPEPLTTVQVTGPPIPEAVGERRHVTVMFCDLVDSTGIAARLDAEEWRDLVGAYLDAASTAVTEMGGKVAKKLGDGLMALFGYPVAQENDAERAVRAALCDPAGARRVEPQERRLGEAGARCAHRDQLGAGGGRRGG